MTEAALDRALDRTLRIACAKREQRGAAGDGTVVVDQVRADEAFALDGLLAPSRRRPVLCGDTLRVPLSQLEAALISCGFDPRHEYERVSGRHVRDLRAERTAREELRTEFHSWLWSHEILNAMPDLAAWFEQAVGTGRVHAELAPLVQRGLEIVGRLLHESGTVQRAVLAAEMAGGDPHALDPGTALHGLTVSLLAAGSGISAEASPREVWAAWNVLVDPVSSYAAALNLPLSGSGVAVELARAAHGTHVVLTYGQLVASQVRWPGGAPCFSCENPSVLVAAEKALGARCPPLVCTGGRPSDAVRLIVACVRRSGERVRHHGDFDESGVQILCDLERRNGAVPWRFDVAALHEALDLLGWSPRLRSSSDLAQAVGELERAIPEELLLDRLIEDLAATAQR